MRPSVPRLPATRVLIALALGLTTAATTPARGEIRLPSIIGDGMVLQQRTDAPVWGWARPGETVRIEATWLDAPIETAGDERGRWIAKLPTPAAGGPFEITITGDNRVTLGDVLVGEVWLCSGQSNMEWPLVRAKDAEREIASADHPGLRLFTVPNVPSLHPRSDCDGSWRECTPDTARGFSAVGYFFGRTVAAEFGVPVGLISADWGGTIIEAWMSADALRPFPPYADALTRIESLRDPNRRGDAAAVARTRWWDALDDDDAWRTAAFDDDAWGAIDVPGAWEADGLDTFDGIVRMRYAFDLPATWVDRPAALELGPIDDRDDTWINGAHVGGMRQNGRWSTPRQYDVPAGVLKSGRNVLAVRVLDTGGPGGLHGAADSVRLLSQNGKEHDAVPLAGTWRYQRGRAMGDLPLLPAGAEVGRNTPTALYNGMIAPITPYGIRGALWYQGESNRDQASRYAKLMEAMITQWRGEWGRGDFPFYYVQIAPFRYGNDHGQTAALREAQLAAMRIPGTGMVVTTDIGNPADIHPADKQTVAKRLALWALARTYGRADVTCASPTYRSMSIEGDAIRIAFDGARGGLVSTGSAVTHFRIAGADRVFHEATAEIDGEMLLVRSAAVPTPVAVRFAWEPAPEPNLFNQAALPASPFRTDDWPAGGE